MARERITFSTRRFLIGRAGPFPRLVFREDVMLDLDQFAYLHTRGEHGGFLIGKKRELKSAEQYEVLVERFVPIRQKEDASRLVITQEHVQTVERALKEGRLEEEIVGWAHTHPGFGVFLSNFDQKQHLRFFPEPWQIAYVMDNEANQRSAYHVVEGDWRRLDGYYVLKEMAQDEIVVAAMGEKRFWPRLALIVLLAVLLVGTAGFGYRWMRELFTPAPVQSPITEVFPEPEVTKVAEQTPAVEGFTPRAEVQPQVEEQKPEQERQSEVSPPAEEPLQFGEYIVQRGDNLWKIAEKLWGDPHLFRLIAEENDLKNPSIIPVGKILRIPPRPKQ